MSTSSRVSVSRNAASGAMSFSTPVDVSACTTATRRASGCSRWASSRRCGSSGCPHSSSMRTTSAPQRRATSHMRSPNTPLAPTIAVSPASSRLTKHASMPADPVPLTGNVSGLVVRKTVRRRAIVSSMIPRNSGSMCPSIGRPSAATASGYGFDGPGPSSRRSVIGIARSLRRPPLPPASRFRAASGPVRDGRGRGTSAAGGAAPRPRRRRRRPGRGRSRLPRARRG